LFILKINSIFWLLFNYRFRSCYFHFLFSLLSSFLFITTQKSFIFVLIFIEYSLDW
jgi:hypothetical protein